MLEVYDDQMYSLNSTDNKYQYDQEFLSATFKGSRFINKCGVFIKNDEVKLKSVILFGGGSSTRIGENSYVIVEDKIFIAVGSSVFCLLMPDLTLEWTVEADDSCCFGIYHFIDSIVVHGELAITCLDLIGNIKWQFYGRDIFVTLNEGLVFSIIDDSVKVKDWEGYVYLIDRNGQMIS